MWRVGSVGCLDPERATLSFRRLVVLVPQIDLGPDSAHQEAVEVPQEPIRDMDELVSKVLQLGPVLVVVRDIPHLNLVDEGVVAFVLDHRLSLVGLVRSDKVRGDGVIHHPEPGLDSYRVIGCTVFAEQVFEHEDRDTRPDLHLSHEVLANHLACKDGRGLLI